MLFALSLPLCLTCSTGFLSLPVSLGLSLCPCVFLSLASSLLPFSSPMSIASLVSISRFSGALSLVSASLFRFPLLSQPRLSHCIFPLLHALITPSRFLCSLSLRLPLPNPFLRRLLLARHAILHSLETPRDESTSHIFSSGVGSDSAQQTSSGVGSSAALTHADSQLHERQRAHR